MTQRITLTILLTTWVVLMLGEAGAYYTARQNLFLLFDDNVVTRAITSLETELNGGKLFLATDDAYARIEPITVLAPGQQLAGKPQAALIRQDFERGSNGRRVRVIGLEITVTP